MRNAKIILINIFFILLLNVGGLKAQNNTDTASDEMSGVQLQEDHSKLEKGKSNYLFSLEAPLWYDFKTADDGKRFKQGDVTYGVLASLLINDIGGVGFEYYEVPIANNNSVTNLEKDKIVFTMMDLIYLVKIPNPFNLAVGVGYGKSEVSGSNENRFKQGDCYQWFLRGGINLNAIIQIHLGYHDVYSKIPFKNNGEYGIEAGGTMFSGGFSVAF
jgi:hypothetical protein